MRRSLMTQRYVCVCRARVDRADRGGRWCDVGARVPRGWNWGKGAIGRRLRRRRVVARAWCGFVAFRVRGLTNDGCVYCFTTA
jgi:hypothetical protein